MNELNFLEHPVVNNIVQEIQRIKAERENVGYNLFTISSYNSYIENFHSDIIASLLNPASAHAEGYKHLHFFIEFLHKRHSANVNIEDFQNVTVLRERGRLDIWIKDETTKASIIIENKINNAPDRDNQLGDF